MGKFASGREALAISDRSGFRYPYRLMKKEWNGLLVGPDEWDPKQPQLGPFRKVVDPEALQDARPETGLEEQRNIQYGFDPVGFMGDESLTPNPLRATGSVGTVTVTV
jgi:hypothetical protein|tara:strand:- start:2290 stop:2613 length:324 start_codon:yes stop_codon:yes gene_type:complete